MKKTTKFKFLLACGCSVFALSQSSPSFAADAAAAETGAEAPADSGQLEEVVVTAQKRSENLQQVPISVSTITPEQLKATGVLKTDDLSIAVPGLQVSHEINSVTTFIRGIGPNSNGTGEESSVVVYLDDLYIEQGNASIFDLNAINDVQVLKGPQGTIFGRNATGGVIQVKTLDPTFEPTVDAHVGYANYQTKSGDLYVSGGLIPGILAANASIYGYNESEGWGRDVVTGQRAFTAADQGGRLKFLLTPTDTTTIKLSAAQLYERGEVGMGLQQIPGSVGAAGAGFVGFYNNENYLNDVSVNKHTLAELRIDQSTPYFKFVSISGWQRMDGYAQFAQDGSPVGLVHTRLNQIGRDLSQEFQFLNPDDASYASWLTWIAGSYYLHDKSGYNHAQLSGAAFGTPPGGFIDLTDQVTTTSIAGFAQATVEVFDDFHVTAGGRYTRDERVYGGGLTLEIPAASVSMPLSHWTGTPNTEKTYNLQSYHISLDYQLTPDVNSYFTFNRGEKSGQFDTFGTASGGPINNPPVNPELLYSYELGVKTEWLDHRLRVNAAAYHYDASNLQYAIIVAGGTELVNAAGAAFDGLDVNFVAKPISHLTISGAIATEYGDYTSFPKAPAYFIPAPNSFNAAGEQTVRTPRFTAQMGIDYIIPETFGDFDLNLTYTHTSSFEYFPDGTLPSPVTDILNASVMWTSPDSMYDVRLWGNNITGQKYYSFGSESLGLGKEFSPAAPATFGITLGFHFNGEDTELPPAAPAPLPPAPPAPVAPAAAAPAMEAARLFQVFFDFDKSDITAAAAKVLRQAADAVTAGHPVKVNVVGHTDTVGSAAYNQALSERRATAVKAGLVADGVPEGEIAATGVGKTGLLVATGDGVREAQNRRAEIVLQ